MDLSKLQEPFDPKDLEWRVQSSGFKNGKPWLRVLTYITARAVMDRLDAVLEPAQWQDSYEVSDKGILCSISILIKDGWVTKSDGSDPTDIEGFKGAISGAFKRAAVKWGVGRYLYDLKEQFAITEGVTRQTPGAHSAKVKNKETNQEEWVYWLPPALPEWALPQKPKAKEPLANARRSQLLRDCGVAADARKLTKEQRQALMLEVFGHGDVSKATDAELQKLLERIESIK